MSRAITVTHEQGAPREHDARSACVSECLKVSYVGTPQQNSALHTVRGPSEVFIRRRMCSSGRHRRY